MASWRTLVFGIIAAIGGVLATATGVPDWAHVLGQIMLAGGSAGTGAVARDNKVTSEQAGAK